MSLSGVTWVMPLHIALLEPQSAAATGAVAARCAAVDASLHLVGPLGFALDGPEFVAARPPQWEALDWWHHPRWRDFRDAMSRERCLYFAADGVNDAADAPYRPNSVLVFGSETLELPERIREKYPDRIFAVPRGTRGGTRLPDAVTAVLALAGDRAGLPAAPEQPPRRPRRRRPVSHGAKR